MSEQFTIYRETGSVLFPEEPSRQADSPPECFDALSRDYVELYVDTGVPELLLYLRATTTLRLGRQDNAFFHYRPESDEYLLEEFARILELNRQETLGSGATDTTEPARKSALPSALVESGLFEEGWSFDRSNAGGEVAELVGLSKLPRYVRWQAHRLTTQEELTRDIATGLDEELETTAVLVEVTASHLCESMRGVETATQTTTRATAGEPTDDDRRQFRRHIDS